MTAANAAPVGYATSFSNSTLYSVDFSAGTATAVGSTGRSNITGLSFQPGTGVLFGIDHATDELVTIDLLTGAATTVGALGVDVFDVGLAFDAAGNLYLTSDSFIDNSNPSLYSVDPSTGAASAIGTGTGTSGIVGLAFDQAGVTGLAGLTGARRRNRV